MKHMPTTVQQDATIHRLFVSVSRSTCFEWYLHPSSGAHVTASTSSGISKTVTATCHSFLLLCAFTRAVDRKCTMLLTKLSTTQWTECSSNTAQVDFLLAYWSVGNLMHAECSVTFLISLYTNWGRICDGEFDSALVKNELMMPYGSSCTKLDNGKKAAIWPQHLNVKVIQSNFQPSHLQQPQLN